MITIIIKIIGLSFCGPCARTGRLAHDVTLSDGGHVAGSRSPVVRGGDGPDDRDVGDPITNAPMLAVDGRDAADSRHVKVAEHGVGVR